MNKNHVTTNESPVTRRRVRVHGVRARLSHMLCKAAFGVTFCCAVAHGWGILWEQGIETAHAVRASAMDYLTPPSQVKEPIEEELSDLITRVSREKDIDPLILTVIAEKESTSGKWLYHFEPDKFQELSRPGGKHARSSDDERRMLSSSHGPFHVLGLSALHFCGSHWSKLYQPLEGARCAASIVHRHWSDTAKIKDPGLRLRETFRLYNGRGQSAEAYADDAMVKLARRLYSRRFDQ